MEGGPGAGGARVVLAIVLERAAGQFALWLVVAAILPGWWRATSNLPGHAFAFGILACLLVIACLALAVLAWRRWRVSPDVKRLMSEAWRTMFAPKNLAIHLPLSLLLVATHTLAFVTIAHGLGLRLPFALAIRMVPLVLVATTLPVFMAGWGVREATVAGLYHLAGLRIAEGVAIALVFGGLSLLASVPGILALRQEANVLDSPRYGESSAGADSLTAAVQDRCYWQNPCAGTGVKPLADAVPLPKQPDSSKPQHRIPLVVVIAQKCSSPLARAWTPVSISVPGGLARSVLVPSPSSPPPFAPQHRTPPVMVNTHVLICPPPVSYRATRMPIVRHAAGADEPHGRAGRGRSVGWRRDRACRPWG